MWGIARAFRGRVLLRIEDHDRTRFRPEYASAILEDLSWLGFVPDFPVLRQSERRARYEERLSELGSAGLVYPCACSRKKVAAVLGSSEGEVRYPGTCRDLRLDGAAHAARRVRFDSVVVGFNDLRLGWIEQIPADQTGDILVRDRHGHWTYQFAVVVDDSDQRVDLVIRGEDILSSTGRQIQLARLLGREKPPAFLHHPLITHPDGVKLSKANRDTGIRELRAGEWNKERVLGAAAMALGIGTGEPLRFDDIVATIEKTGRA